MYWANPRHPYTQGLLSAIPVIDQDGSDLFEKTILEGDIPSPTNPPIGCNFNTRCKIAEEICYSDEPVYREIEAGHFVACHLA